MNVNVQMPDKVWGRLASIADKQGVRVADVIADAIAEKIGVPKRRKARVVTCEVAEQIKVLHALNWPFTEIAKQLGLQYSTVRAAAKRMDLESLRGAGQAARRGTK